MFELGTQVKDWPTHKEQCGDKGPATNHGCAQLQLESMNSSGDTGKGGGQDCSNVTAKAMQTLAQSVIVGPEIDLSHGAKEIGCQEVEKVEDEASSAKDVREPHCASKETQVKSENAEKDPTCNVGFKLIGCNQKEVEDNCGAALDCQLSGGKMEQCSHVFHNVDKSKCDEIGTCTTWVPVALSEVSQPVEIETEKGGKLPLTSVSLFFPGTIALKFRGPSQQLAFCETSVENGDFLAPPGGWGVSTKFIAVQEEIRLKREDQSKVVGKSSKAIRCKVVVGENEANNGSNCLGACGGRVVESNINGKVEETEVEDGKNGRQVDPDQIGEGSKAIRLLQESASDNLFLASENLGIDDGKMDNLNLEDVETTKRLPEEQMRKSEDCFQEKKVDGSQHVNLSINPSILSEAENVRNQAVCVSALKEDLFAGPGTDCSLLPTTWTPVSKVKPASVFIFDLCVDIHRNRSPVRVKLAHCALLVEESEDATEVVRDILAAHHLWVRRLEGSLPDKEGMQQVQMKTEEGSNVVDLLTDFGLVQNESEQLFFGQGKVHRFTEGEWEFMWRGEVSVVRCREGFLMEVQGKDSSNVLFDSRSEKLLWTKVKTRKYYWTKEGSGRDKEQWVVVLASPHQVTDLAELVEKLVKSFEDDILKVEEEYAGSTSGKHGTELFNPEGSYQQLGDCDLLSRESRGLAMPGLGASSRSDSRVKVDEEEKRILNPAELEDPSSFSTCMPGIGGVIKARLLDTDAKSSNFFVCGEKEWEELILFQEQLQENCSKFQGNPQLGEEMDPGSIQPLQLVVFRSSEDTMWYRGIVMKVHKGICKLFCPDYGFIEKVSLLLLCDNSNHLP